MLMFLNGARILFAAVILAIASSAQTFTTLYNFGSYSHDATRPWANVIVGPQGELYGTTYAGGEENLGTVYELLPPASPGGAWTDVVLHSFVGTDGSHPEAGLAMGPNGALYGVTAATTIQGEWGVAFELDPPTGGSRHWRYTAIYPFTSATAAARLAV